MIDENSAVTGSMTGHRDDLRRQRTRRKGISRRRYRRRELQARADGAGARRARLRFRDADVQMIGGVTRMRASALRRRGPEMSRHLFPEASSHLLAVTPTLHWLDSDWAEPVWTAARDDGRPLLAPIAPSRNRWAEMP